MVQKHRLKQKQKKVKIMVKIHDLRPITPRTNGTRKESSIKHIARHHSGGTSGDWYTFWPYWNKTKGWGTGGYAEIILRDGSVQLCYDPNEITNGVGGHNSTTYSICVVGNGSFTDAQERTWEERCLLNLKRFNLSPDDVKGHREFSGTNTACPGIDMGMVRNRLIYLLLSTVKGSVIVSSYLKRGDTGLSVNNLQENLIKVGLKLSVDSSYGPATENAVKAFQTANGLKADGSYGPATKVKLEAAVKPKPIEKPASSNKTPKEKELLHDPSSFTLKQSAPKAFKRAHELGILTSDEWALKAEKGELSESDVNALTLEILLRTELA